MTETLVLDVSASCADEAMRNLLETRNFYPPCSVRACENIHTVRVKLCMAS